MKKLKGQFKTQRPRLFPFVRYNVCIPLVIRTQAKKYNWFYLVCATPLCKVSEKSVVFCNPDDKQTNKQTKQRTSLAEVTREEQS